MDGDTFGVVCYADQYGNWSNEYDGLANGSHSVTAQASDLAGNTADVCSNRFYRECIEQLNNKKRERSITLRSRFIVTYMPDRFKRSASDISRAEE